MLLLVLLCIATCCQQDKLQPASVWQVVTCLQLIAVCLAHRPAYDRCIMAFCRWQVCTKCSQYCRAPTTRDTLYCDGCLQPVHRGCKTAFQHLSHPNGGVDDADSKHLPIMCHILMHITHCACHHDHQQDFVFNCPTYSHIRSQHLDLLQHCCTFADFMFLCEPNTCGGLLRECFACRKQILFV